MGRVESGSDTDRAEVGSMPPAEVEAGLEPGN